MLNAGLATSGSWRCLTAISQPDMWISRFKSKEAEAFGQRQVGIPTLLLAKCLSER